MNKIIEFIKNNKKVFTYIIYIIIPILLELIFFKKITLKKDSILRLLVLYGIELLILIYKVLDHYSNKVKKLTDLIIKYRYIIAVIIFIIAVMFKINFSSVDAWCARINENETSTIIGKHRDIRSDEWLTQTPIYISQTENENGYTITNKNYMQGNASLLMILAPVWDITTISRPAIWGYLLFGSEYGFSWWWMLRVLLLILVSFELVRIITKKDNVLTIAGTLMLALAPPMMWWLSTAVVDAYIYGLAIIVLFNYYMEHLECKIWKKILIALGMIICIPSFAYALYPAIQVPLAFVIAIFIINDLLKHYKKIKKKDYIIMSITIFIIMLLLAHFVIVSWEDIKIMLSTVYPGHRYETGGDYSVKDFMKYFINIFLPYTDSVGNNPCEQSAYIYPLIGLIILIIQYINGKIKEKQEDKFLKVGLIVLFIILLIWLFIGFNDILSKITLLYFSPAMRTQLIVGLLGVILILMLLKTMEKQKIFNNFQAITISVIVTVFSYILIKNSIYNQFFTTIKLYVFLPMIFAMTYFLIKLDKKKFAYLMCIISIVAGIFVNPITSGIKVLNKTEISHQIHKIEQEDKDKIWIGRTDKEAQYLLANGVNTLNGVHNYPNFNWLNIVDKEKKYNEIYNRYAHISIELAYETEFILIEQDDYKAKLTYEDIKNIGVEYYFTMEECSESIIKDFKLSTIYENENKNQYIYKFN